MEHPESFTKELLPVVTNDLIEGIIYHTMLGKMHTNDLDEIYEGITAENPAVTDYFISCTINHVDLGKGAETTGPFLLYWLLKSMGESLLLEGKQPNLPKGGYTREGLPIIKSIRFAEWENAADDISEDEEETLATLTGEIWAENRVLAEHIEQFRRQVPENAGDIIIKNTAILYLAMKRQSALYISGAEK
jgi:hypothetical protein